MTIASTYGILSGSTVFETFPVPLYVRVPSAIAAHSADFNVIGLLICGFTSQTGHLWGDPPDRPLL